MKAIICTTYGSPEVLQLQEVAKPVPRDHEILVKVSATTVTTGDIRLRSATVPLSYWLPAHLLFGWSKPRKAILGMVVAGEVEAVGNAVTRFQRGDQVFAYDITRFRTYAEYTCLPENSAIALKPSTVTYEEAAVIPFGGITAFFVEATVHIDTIWHGQVQACLLLRPALQEETYEVMKKFRT